MRTFGLDVHKRFIEIALHEDGRLSRVGRVEIDQLDVFAAGRIERLVTEHPLEPARFAGVRHTSSIRRSLHSPRG